MTPQASDVDAETAEYVIQGTGGGPDMVRYPGKRYGFVWGHLATVMDHWTTQALPEDGPRTHMTVLRCEPDVWSPNQKVHWAVVLWSMAEVNADMCRTLHLDHRLAVDVYAMGILEHVRDRTSARVAGRTFAALVANGVLALPPGAVEEHARWQDAANQVDSPA